MKAVNTKGKLGLIRWMMIATQILLLGFTLHWLNLQYMERQHLLLKDIGEAWSESQQQMVDTMLLKEYIMPAMDSSSGRRIRYEYNKDSSKRISADRKTTKISVTRPSILPKGARQIILRINDSSDAKNATGKPTQSIMTRELVLRGVKLFVKKHGDSDEIRSFSSIGGLRNPDTTLLKTAFLRRISAIDPSIQLIWTTDTISDNKGKHQMISYRMAVGEKNLVAGVKGYQVKIVRDILPQLFFAFLLLLLSSAAFIFSFRSLKTQIRLNNQRNDFIRNMSHELKTPVATVKVALEALKNFNGRNNPKVMDEYLDMATSETSRLEMLISRVMSISAGTEEALEPDREVVNLQSLIHEVLISFKPRLDAEKASINLVIPEEEVILNIDRLHIQGVLINLIDNSLKYSMPPVQIDLSMFVSEEIVTVTVADLGIGIPSEYRSRIFGKFFRVPTGELHNVKGYGLGLSYAKLVVEQHGGNIKYSERPGGGSIFEFTIPMSSL